MAARPKSPAPRNAVANIRLTAAERSQMEAAASSAGLHSLSEYLRFLHSQHLEGTREDQRTQLREPDYVSPQPFHHTKFGVMYEGDSLGLLHQTLAPKSVDLIMTSPPFGLVRKKTYGNEDADAYLKWFRPFARGFRRVLKARGSLVIDIGGSWKPGIPTRSLYHFELLVMLCREYGFHLCQEHYWWNPAKLPTPAEWVNIRRVRVKDAVNCVWWLSPTPWPKASNRRVLMPYSDSMRGLLKNGYRAKLRPSGHNISTKFQRDNGGSVPPNLIALANTESNSKYQAYCRERNLPVHPARYPAGLSEYFVRMLTDRGDLVLDPFAGSCVTGEVCERLERKWICGELSHDYLSGALGRFQDARTTALAGPVKYQIHSPGALPFDDSTPLADNGGASRKDDAAGPGRDRRARK